MEKKGSKLIAFKIPKKYYEVLEELCKDALENSKYDKEINPVNYYIKDILMRFIAPFYQAKLYKNHFRDINFEKYIEGLIKADNIPYLSIEMVSSINGMIKYKDKMLEINKKFKKVVEDIKKQYDETNK